MIIYSIDTKAVPGIHSHVTTRRRGAIKQIRKTFFVQIIFNAILHDIFNDWHPTRHIIAMGTFAFFTRVIVHLLTVTLKL